MTATIHEIELTSNEQFHGEVPPRQIGYLLAGIQPAARAVVAMAFRNRSTTRGQVPGWLRKSADVRFVGFSGNGTTRLRFKAPRLKDAATQLYEQAELFPTRPNGADTAFDLLLDTLADVAAGNENSDRFDRALLRKISEFRKVLRGPFTDIEILGRDGRSAHVSPKVIESAHRLCEKTPPPRRVRVVGKLDAISDSRQAFELLMDDNERVRGVLLLGSISDVVPLFGKRVLLFGQAHFRPSGVLLRVDADEFRLATEADNFFSKVPKPLVRERPKPTAFDREKMAKGLRSIMGQWPGDETDEEIEAALREIG